MNPSAVLWIGSRTPRAEALRILAAAGYRVSLAGSIPEALPLLGSAPPDVIVLATPDGDVDPGTSVREVLSAAPSSWVVVVVSSPEDTAAALAAGAHDALPFDADEMLPMRIMIWARAAHRGREAANVTRELALRVRTLEERVSEVQRENDQLKDLAHRDELTGLGNRRSFRAHLEQSIEFSRRYGGPISILVADLDGMKRLNDECGHPAGDAALRRIAEIFRASIRGADHAARLGGDEFAVCMPATGAVAAARVAERIRTRIETLLLPNGHSMSSSFGVATLDNPRGVGFAADELFARADAACYTAKRAGKNRVEIDGLDASDSSRGAA